MGREKLGFLYITTMRERDDISVAWRGVAWIGVVPVVQAAFNEAGGHSEVLALDRKITERFLSTHFLYVQNVFYCKNCIV